MEKLEKKTFYTIFSIISLFIVVTIIVFNVQSYSKEYNGIKRNLTRMNMMFFGGPNRKPINQNFDDLNNKIIMDYDFYTFILDRKNNIIHKISHNENGFDNKIINKANRIIFNNYNSNIKINSLYFSDISYNFQSGEYLVIVDTSNIRYRLSSLLLISILILGLSEMLVYYVSKKITKWIVSPVEETFNKQKDFIADASHELKTPLAVMMASIDCIEVNKKNEKYINNMKSESDRMNNLITKLLDLSKSESGTNKELYTMNNLSKIVEKRTLVFESLAFENNVSIDTQIEKDVMLKCSKIEIDEVVSILIDNAIKHSYKNSIIKVNLYKDKNNIILDIINNGKDIPNDECDKIFERFYRSDKSRNRDSNRYGLGLAIAKNIVNNHDGSIIAFSKDNCTTFRVTFKQKEH
ncbi:MAG: HAMP domain-containing histidine kinase [Bacilli bacterium]|nr:HAMP domain-containing histidine kinase [Bacilli bacterium]